MQLFMHISGSEIVPLSFSGFSLVAVQVTRVCVLLAGPADHFFSFPPLDGVQGVFLDVIVAR